MNPRSHLRLVYEANPLAMLAEQVRVARLPQPLYFPISCFLAFCQRALLCPHILLNLIQAM
jgi:hypothetical protein